MPKLRVFSGADLCDLLVMILAAFTFLIDND
jgi:hypothetical protein